MTDAAVAAADSTTTSREAMTVDRWFRPSVFDEITSQSTVTAADARAVCLAVQERAARLELALRGLPAATLVAHRGVKVLSLLIGDLDAATESVERFLEQNPTAGELRRCYGPQVLDGAGRNGHGHSNGHGHGHGRHIRDVEFFGRNWSDKDLKQAMAEARWPGGKVPCLFCGAETRVHGACRWLCESKECRKGFGVLTGTPLNAPRVGLRVALDVLRLSLADGCGLEDIRYVAGRYSVSLAMVERLRLGFLEADVPEWLRRFVMGEPAPAQDCGHVEDEEIVHHVG